MYVLLEVNHPEVEEHVVMRMFRGFLKEDKPFSGGDIMDLAATYNPLLRNTGFLKWADPNLLFHAALRLVGKGELEAAMDMKPLPKGSTKSYGNRRFYVAADVEISLSGVLCDSYSDEFGSSSASLHQQCFRRLCTALAKAKRA